MSKSLFILIWSRCCTTLYICICFLRLPSCFSCWMWTLSFLNIFLVWPLWRHQIETFSALLVLCAGNSPVTGEFPSQRSVTRNFDVFFDLRLSQQLSKQSKSGWFETPSRSLWRHCNGISELENSARGVANKYSYRVAITCSVQHRWTIHVVVCGVNTDVQLGLGALRHCGGQLEEQWNTACVLGLFYLRLVEPAGAIARPGGCSPTRYPWGMAPFGDTISNAFIWTEMYIFYTNLTEI